MSDSKKPETTLPSWQVKADTFESKREEPSTSEMPTSTPDSKLETARKFLEDQEVRSASTDAKIAFLEKKGFEQDVISELLGITRNAEATSPTNLQTPKQDSMATTTTPKPPPPQSLQPRQSPPIITYPEFLTTPPQPAPLITAQRLLTTLYLFGGLSALLYGTSTQIVAPMVAALTESRHSLAETAQANLDKLIQKLESVVSEIPSQSSTIPQSSSDSDSDSDPTEMFHRDIGIQTSLPSTPRPQTPTIPTTTPVEDQTTRLRILQSHIQSLNEASTSEGQDAAELTTTVDVLREYLTSLAYVQPTYTYGVYGNATADKQDENDKISEIKAQIRQVKGVLLSTRSFPSSTRVR